jgi:hypothetical protein
VGILLRIFLARFDDGVLADADIITFLLHPTGLTALVVIGAVSLGVLFVEQGVLMVIGFGAVEDRRVTWLDGVGYVGGYAREMVKLAGHALVRLLLVAASFLGAVGVVYLIFLTDYDINFYLTNKPPEWWWAVAWAAAIMGALAVVVLRPFLDGFSRWPWYCSRADAAVRPYGKAPWPRRRTGGVSFCCLSPGLPVFSYWPFWSISSSDCSVWYWSRI